MEQQPRKDHNGDADAAEVSRRSELYACAALDGLSSHVAILDAQGRIEFVNKAWRDFAEANPPVARDVCEGADYLAECDRVQGAEAEDARQTAGAIRDVLAGLAETFTLEYPCHSPTVQRWFSMRITRYPGAGPPRAIVVHENITERKLAEEALRASEERFRDLTERTSDWVWETDERGVYTYASPRVRDLLGREPEEVVGKTPFDFMPEGEVSRLREVFSRVVSERADIRLLENTLVCRDGSLVVMETNGIPIIDESGVLRGYRGIDRDITERKRMEEDLRRLWHAVEQSPDAVVITDSQGAIEYVNPKFTQLTGYTLEEVIGQNPRILKSGETPPEEYKRLWDTITSGGEWRGEFHNKKKDGGLYWESASISPVKYPNGTISHFIAIKEDITERKRMQEALRRSEDKFRSIVETTKEWIWEIDMEGLHTYSNPGVQDILGFTAEEIIGASSFPIIHEDDRPKIVELLADSAARKEGWSGLLIRWVHKDGSYRWLESNAVPLLDDSGNVTGFRGSDRDVTGRKQEEELLSRSAERDRQIAEILQQTLIPPQIPMQPAGYEIAARYQPALQEAEVCGDFYDLIDLGDGKIGIVIGDLMGKGLSAAAGVAAVRQTIRSYAHLDYRPSGVVTLVNEALCRDLVSESDMLTAFYTVLDTRTGRLAYTNAGHEPPLLRRADGRIEFLATGGPMLSGIGDMVYPEGELTLQPGDLIVMVTDGITEARIADTLEFFGTEGVVRCLSDHVGASAEQIATALLEDAISFAKGELRDDAAIVVVRKLNDSGHAATQGSDIAEPQSVAGADEDGAAILTIETKRAKRREDP